MTEFRKWNEYVTEADHEPFRLEVSDDKVILIRTPTGEQVAEAQELAVKGGGVREQLRVICGDAADEVLPLAMAAPAGALNALVTDIMAHFGMSPGEAPSRT